MPTTPTYRTWTTGEIVTANELNTEIRDNGTNSWTPTGFKSIVADNNIPTNSETGLSGSSIWSSTPWDSDSFHTTNNYAGTVPVGFGGTYLIGFGGAWDIHADALDRRITFTCGASVTVIDSVAAQQAGVTSHNVTQVVTLTAGDILAIKVFQKSGGNLYFRGGYIWAIKLK